MRTHGRKNKKGQSKFTTLKRKRKLTIGGGGTTLKGDDNIVQYKISKNAPTIIYLGKFKKYKMLGGKKSAYELDLYVDIMPFLVKFDINSILVRFDLVWKSKAGKVIDRKIQLVAKYSDSDSYQKEISQNKSGQSDYSMEMYDITRLTSQNYSDNIKPSQISYLFFMNDYLYKDTIDEPDQRNLRKKITEEYNTQLKGLDLDTNEKNKLIKMINALISIVLFNIRKPPVRITYLEHLNSSIRVYMEKMRKLGLL